MNTSQTGNTGTSEASPGFAAFKAESSVSFVRAFDPKVAIPMDGYTHQVIRYRDTKGTASKPAKMVTVPALTLPAYKEEFKQDAEGVETDEVIRSGYGFMPEDAWRVLVDVLESAQSDIIRNLIESGKTVIEWSDVDLDKCLAFLTAARVSNRLTKEAVEAWAKIALAKACEDRAKEIAMTKGYDAEKTKAQIEGTTAAYVANVSKLAAAVPNIGMETAQACSLMLERANVDDDIAKALKKKLYAILNPDVAKDL